MRGGPGGGPRSSTRAAGAWLGALGLLLVVVACKSGSKSERIRRSTDQAPVVVVEPSAPSVRTSESVGEREPNDQPEEANALALDAIGRGRLESPSDVDRYRLTVTKAGALTVTVSAVAAVDLVVELRDSGDAVLAKSDRGGAKISEGLGGYPVTPGTYDVVVREFVKRRKSKAKAKSGAPASPGPGEAGAPSEAYEVVASLPEPRSRQELEPNFDVGTASDAVIGESVTGLIGWSGDVDVWKVGIEVLSSNNVLDLELSAVEGVALTLEVRDGLGRTQATRKGSRSQSVAIHSWAPVVQEGAPPFLYLVVSGDRSHPQLAYQLGLAARLPGSADEVEPNDRPELAQAVGVDEPLRHARWEVGDVDCFELPAGATSRRVEATVDAAAGTNLTVELLVGDRVVATSDEPTGKIDRVTAEVPAGARAVVRVRGAAKPGVDGSYDVSWAEVDEMPPEEGALAPP